ncbi:hypothetical protein IQ254_26855 [Nodosilinea sp. LEGE 07088]|uniref:hypothetical protein n=1 Tax=Nodosilinea sp. LEGE 07088 TaxID=2777968 RepID=UPI001881DD62|nr:hypothetical protein [Nodosilinea sp. LEGE 07088]MBE9140777.1 hypothetical protein [Nodosilinea sp. LEGE 07088]
MAISSVASRPGLRSEVMAEERGEQDGHGNGVGELLGHPRQLATFLNIFLNLGDVWGVGYGFTVA